MSWESSNRRSRLPSDWDSRRLLVLRRDSFRCRIGSVGCLVVATEVDHAVAGDNHSLNNLQAVCSACHKAKTQMEGLAKRQRLRSQRFRPKGRHPGAS
uniref:HNH endonuclease n=1 Tax=Siphoviridae sp. ctGkF2 TaxID=2827823 RepID=A0A8S5TKY4_9CAUD|nr:MAG TPA: HNH endonuclease [Siphoviridae sp. ctGkF2]